MSDMTNPPPFSKKRSKKERDARRVHLLNAYTDATGMPRRQVTTDELPGMTHFSEGTMGYVDMSKPDTIHINPDISDYNEDKERFTLAHEANHTVGVGHSGYMGEYGAGKGEKDVLLPIMKPKTNPHPKLTANGRSLEDITALKQSTEGMRNRQLRYLAVMDRAEKISPQDKEFLEAAKHLKGSPISNQPSTLLRLQDFFTGDEE